MTARSRQELTTSIGPLVVDPATLKPGNTVKVVSKGGPVTLEAWRDHAQRTPNRPKMPPRTQYDKASTAERAAFDALRLSYNRGLSDIETPQMTIAHRDMTSRADGSDGCPPTARTGLIVNGESNLGKSTILVRWGKQFEVGLRASLGVDWDARTELGGIFVPVVYVILGRDEGPKGLCQKMLHFYGQPHAGMTVDVMTRQLQQLAVVCGTRTVLIDQMQNLQMANKSGLQTAMHLKELMDILPITVFGAAVRIDETRFFSDAQIAGRFGVTEIGACTLDDQPDRRGQSGAAAFRGLLETVHAELLLFDKQKNDMALLAPEIHRRTQGVTGDIMDLLRRGANEAIGREERLTRSVLDRVELSRRATAESSGENKRTRMIGDATAAAASKAAREAAHALRNHKEPK